MVRRSMDDGDADDDDPFPIRSQNRHKRFSQS